MPLSNDGWANTTLFSLQDAQLIVLRSNVGHSGGRAGMHLIHSFVYWTDLVKHPIVEISGYKARRFFHRRLHASLRKPFFRENGAVMNYPWDGPGPEGADGLRRLVQDTTAWFGMPSYEFPPQLSRLFQEAKSSPVLLLADIVLLNGALRHWDIVNSALEISWLHLNHSWICLTGDLHWACFTIRFKVAFKSSARIDFIHL